MRTRFSLLSPLVNVALCAAAVSPAAAQQAAASEYVRPVVRHAAVAADPALVRTVAVYQFVASHDAGIPKEVTVADSAGVLVATFRLPGATATRPMMVEVLNTDLVLQGETPWGVLTLVLYENDPERLNAVVGRWILGDKEGKLRAAR